jgi:ribosomal peptide maturation radical SAM protein 1
MSRPLRVLLVSMPWHALDRPSLGLSLLQAAMRRDGVECDVRYLGFRLADRIGLPDYLWVQSALPHPAFAGEWLFSSALYGRRPETDERYLDSMLCSAWGIPDEAIIRLLRMRRRLAPFLRECLETIDWAGYDIVGFTSTFEQNIPSLALARLVKQAHPGLVTVFGGANWEGEMGQELHARFPFVDVAFSGEADLSFPTYIRTLREGGDPYRIPGLVVRCGDASVSTGPASPVHDLDRLPYPCYDDYFTQLAQSADAAFLTPSLLLESSRGCWWGARHHCTFCGLNAETMAFRSKSPGRVLAEIEHLHDRHGVRRIAAVDNILDMRYFRTVLPALAAGPGLDLFYEVKANLTAGQVLALAQAGVRNVQPGVESLSDHVLALMRKGTTALQNVQLLKWCREFGVHPIWNLLYGFPGETAEDYDAMVPLVESIGFLTPPDAIEPVRLDRFSPYFGDPAAFGLTNVRPLPAYEFIYPFPAAARHRIACYFDYDHADGRDPLAYADPVLGRFQRWRDHGPRGSLTLARCADGALLVTDTRAGRPVSRAFTGWRAAVYARCDSVTAERVAVAAGARQGAGAEAVRQFLAECLENQIMANVGDRWLALAVWFPSRLEPEDRPG